MTLRSFGSVSSVFFAAASCVFTMTASSTAFATDWLFPNLMPATDAEIGPVSWTGFIAAPDIDINTNLNVGGPGSIFLDDADGFSIGAKLGYDKQYGDIVVGVAGNALYSFADGTSCCGYETELNYYGTLRGRLGYSFGRLLVVGTAGWAFGELEINDTILHNSDSQTLSGWVAGGGIEYVWNKDITFRAGYMKIEFDDEKFSNLPAGFDKVETDIDVIDVGLVHRF